jgi:hypothetical protein
VTKNLSSETFNVLGLKWRGGKVYVWTALECEKGNFKIWSGAVVDCISD